ncbi:hypothetical protein [Nocardia sp. NPDC057668]|uniref:hypothetical protein n=1 Tax=Nocardia sp. NPDC057668 TaxID=3346202 RepID=UPI00366EEB9B
MKKPLILACSLLAAANLATAVAHADTASPADVRFTVTPGETATAITIDAGALRVENGVFSIESPRGDTLARAEMSFRVDDFVFPIDAAITGRDATLTPRLDLAHAAYRPVALPFENEAPWKTQYEREQAAWARLTSTLQLGAAIGTAVGGIGGAAVGCVLGGIAGATIASAAIIGLFGGFIPAAAVGCLGGIVALGPLGTLAGTLLVTAPVTLLAAAQYFTTINSPLPKR